MSLTRPLGRVRTALPFLVTRSLLPRGAGPLLIAVGWPPPGCMPVLPAVPGRPPAVVIERDPVVVVEREFVVVVVRAPPPLAVGPWLAPLAVGPCDAAPPVLAPRAPPPAPPPAGLEAGLAAGLAAGAAFAGAAFLFSAPALAMPTAPSSPARAIAAEPYLNVLQRSRIVICILISVSGRGPLLNARTTYSTLLTFPLVKVTFMSL